MAILAVITNCALIALSPSIRTWLHADSNPVLYVLFFVVMEVSDSDRVDLKYLQGRSRSYCPINFWAFNYYSRSGFYKAIPPNR